MSSIADALRRAQQERQRMEHPKARRAGEHEGEADCGSLASVMFRREVHPGARADRSVSPSSDGGLAEVIGRQGSAGMCRAAPAGANQPSKTQEAASSTPLSEAIRQGPAVPPPAMRTEQRAAETIVEDYAAKRRLDLPSSLVVYHDRSSATAEHYRKMRDTLMAENPRRDSRMLVVTSSRAGEGKTVTTFNLGLSLAEIRANRVLLIDGCLHAESGRQSLSDLLRQHQEPGLAEILAATSTDTVDSLLKATPWHNLFLLPVGARTAPTAAASLLQSQNLRAALRRLRSSFQWILVDAPAAVLPDPGLLGTASDGMLLAVAMHRTRRDVVEKTIRRLRSMNLPLKSCILTRA